MLFLPCVVPLFAAASGMLFADGPDFSVRFGRDTIAISGKVNSAETRQALTEAVKSARPDLGISTDRLSVDPETDVPKLTDLKSLLSELGLSTHEGRFEVWPDRVLIGGLTDSVVTLTALKIRLEPILEGRRLINHICIVGTEDLPEIALSLSGGALLPGSTEAVKKTVPEPAFEYPGLLLEKLYPMLLMLGDFDRIEGKSDAPASALRAMPVEVTALNPDTPTTPSPPSLPPMDAGTPVQQYETLPSVRFSRNSFLLQANQVPIFDELAKQLLAPQRKGRLVILEPVKPSGGSSAFNEYLSERRGEEVKRFLAERGIDAGTLSVRVVESSSTVDEGEVRLRVEIPLPPPPPLAEAPVDAGNPGTTGNSAEGSGPSQARDLEED